MPITRIATPTVSNPRVTFSITSLNARRRSHPSSSAARLHRRAGSSSLPWLISTQAPGRRPEAARPAAPRTRTRRGGPASGRGQDRRAGERRARVHVPSSTDATNCYAASRGEGHVRRAGVPSRSSGPCRCAVLSLRWVSWWTASITRAESLASRSGTVGHDRERGLEPGRGVIPEPVRLARPRPCPALWRS